MKKVAIIGAGISGLSIAHLLKNKGYSVVVYEKSDMPGGLIKCSNEKAGLFHRVGGHVFNSKNQEVLDWFFSFFDKEQEYLKAPRNAKILMNENIIGYPIENYLYQLPPQYVEKIISDLIQIQKSSKEEFSDFESFLKNNFGETLFELYFQPYNSKIWNTSLNNIPLPWLEGKLPMPNYKEIIISNILRNQEKEMVHSTFFYPRKGGSSFIANRLAEDLDIICNVDVKIISKSNNEKWVINDIDQYDSVVFTGDIRKLADSLIIDNECWKNIHPFSNSDFKSNGTSTVFCETEGSDLSWFYLPEKDKKSHRIIYTGNFSPNNNVNKLTCSVEFSGIVDRDTIDKELSMMPGNLIPVAYNFEENSYVIQNFNTRKSINSIKGDLKKHNFFLLGRFAEWEYYNMDKAIESAMQLAKTYF